MKNIVKYVGLVAAQGIVAFLLAVFLIGPALRGEPMPWQKRTEPAEKTNDPDEQHATADEESDAGAEHGAKEGKKEKDKGKKKPESEIGGLLPIESVIVNVAETQGRRFLKASLTLEVDGEENIEAATARLPVYRGAVMDVLSSKNLDELVSPDSRTRIRGEILQALNSKDESLEFKDLFFTEFIVQ